MGTCLDWESSIRNGFETINSKSLIHGEEASKLAIEWRHRYFTTVRERTNQRLPPEDIDVTHRRILDLLFEERGIGLDQWSEPMRQELVRRWHVQRAWPDMAPALKRLEKHFDLVVHANGTTRLQIDLMRSSGLHFHAVISSIMLGISKPDPQNYLKALELLKLKPEECMTVAAHAWDVRGAKAIGMQTAYIRRATEDPDGDMAEITKEFDYFLDGRGGGIDTGLDKLADILLSEPQ